MSLNEYAYTPEELEQMEEEDNLNNQIILEQEIDGHIIEWKAQETDYANLQHLAQSLESEGGLSRHMVEEIRHFYPDFASGRPLNSFSSMPSQTYYREAREELSTAAAAAIGAGIVAILAFLGMAIDNYFDISKSSGGDGGGGGGKRKKKKKGYTTDAENVGEQVSNNMEAVAQSAGSMAEIADDGFKDIFKEGIIFKIGEDSVGHANSLEDVVGRLMRDATKFKVLNVFTNKGDTSNYIGSAAYSLITRSKSEDSIYGYLLKNAQSMKDSVELLNEALKNALNSNGSAPAGNEGSENPDPRVSAVAAVSAYAEGLNKFNAHFKHITANEIEAVPTVRITFNDFFPKAFSEIKEIADAFGKQDELFGTLATSLTNAKTLLEEKKEEGQTEEQTDDFVKALRKSSEALVNMNGYASAAYNAVMNVYDGLLADMATIITFFKDNAKTEDQSGKKNTYAEEEGYKKFIAEFEKLHAEYSRNVT